VADGEGVHCLGHFATFALLGVEVDFYEDVEIAPSVGVRDGCVASYDGFPCYGVAQPEHKVLANWEAEQLIVVLKFEGEESGVPGGALLGV